MPAPTNVKVTFTGDTSQLTAASKQASAAIASTGQAADKAAAKIKAISDDAADVGDKFGKAGGSAAKMAGALSLVSPAAADSARNLADLADVGELASEASAALGISATAAAVSLGAVLSAVALLAAAYAGWNEEAATATRLTEQQNALTAAMAPLYNDTEAAIRGAKVELGLMTEAQAEMIEAGLSGLEQYQTATEDTRKRLSELRASQASVTGQVGAFLGDVGEALPFQEWNLAAQIIDGLTTSTAEFDTEEGRLTEGLAAAAGEVERNRKAHEALTGAKKKGAAATKVTVEMEKAAELAAQARREAEEDLAKLLEERRQKEEEYAAAIGTITGEREDAEQSLLTTEQQIEKERQAARARVLAAASQALELARGNGIKEAQIREETQAALAAIDNEAARKRTKAITDQQEREAALMDAYRAETAAKQKAAQEETRASLIAFGMGVADLTGQILGAAADSASAALDAAMTAAADAASQIEEIDRLLEGLGTSTVDAAKLSGDALVEAYRSGQVAAEELSDAQRSQIESQLEAEKAAAQELQKAQQAAALSAWEDQHAAALATALLNIPLAVSQALGSAPFPFNIPLAAAAGGLAAKAAADVASQAPPSFRTGYMPDQQLAYIEPGSEMVVPASGVQAMGGRQAAEQAFAGVAPSGGAQTTYFTMGHRAFSALVQGSAGRPGPLRDLTIRPGAGRRLRR